MRDLVSRVSSSIHQLEFASLVCSFTKKGLNRFRYSASAGFVVSAAGSDLLGDAVRDGADSVLLGFEGVRGAPKKLLSFGCFLASFSFAS
jgi:hypothetical protein